MEDKDLGKFKNIYIMLLSSIINEDIRKVDHFLDDKLASHYEQIIDKNKKQNVWQHFDYPNISNVKIVYETENEITISAKTRYCFYKTNKISGMIVEGDNSAPQIQNVLLVFRKNNIKEKACYECPNCGASLNLNAKSLCDYCGSPVDERFSPYVLSEIKYL